MEVEMQSFEPSLDAGHKGIKNEVSDSSKEYELRKTYQLDFAKLGFPGKKDFNAYDFFINHQPIAGTSIHFDEMSNMVAIDSTKQMALLEFLSTLGIGLQQGAFKIQDYVMSSPEQRKDLEDTDGLPN